MDDWLRQLQDNIDAAAKDSSEWLLDISREADKLADDWVEASVDSLDEIQEALDPTLSQIQAALSPTLEQINDRLMDAADATEQFVAQDLTPWVENAVLPISCTVNPLLQNHPVCVGCKFYNGSNFGDTMLVCGMHPYGPETETCGDKESIWPVVES